jgi:hypothetical protein
MVSDMHSDTVKWYTEFQYNKNILSFKLYYQEWACLLIPLDSELGWQRQVDPWLRAVYSLFIVKAT